MWRVSFAWWGAPAHAQFGHRLQLANHPRLFHIVSPPKHATHTSVLVCHDVVSEASWCSHWNEWGLCFVVVTILNKLWSMRSGELEQRWFCTNLMIVPPPRREFCINARKQLLSGHSALTLPRAPINCPTNCAPEEAGGRLWPSISFHFYNPCLVSFLLFYLWHLTHLCYVGVIGFSPSIVILWALMPMLISILTTWVRVKTWFSETCFIHSHPDASSHQCTFFKV